MARDKDTALGNIGARRLSHACFFFRVAKFSHFGKTDPGGPVTLLFTFFHHTPTVLLTPTACTQYKILTPSTIITHTTRVIPTKNYSITVSTA